MLVHTRSALKIGSHPPTEALAFHVGSRSAFRQHSLPPSLSFSLAFSQTTLSIQDLPHTTERRKAGIA